MARRKNTYIFAPEPTRRRGPGCLILFLAILLAILVLAILSNEALSRKLTLESAKIPVMSLDKTYEGFSILHISDLHASALGTDLDIWRTLLYGKRYHAAVLTGDMVGQGGDYAPLVALIEILQNVNSTAPIYFIAGDDDPQPIVTTYRGTPEVYSDWVIAAKNAGAIYLDAPVRQQVGKYSVWFVPEYLYSVDVEGMLSSLTYQRLAMEEKGQQYEAEGGSSYRALLSRIDAMERTVEAMKTISSNDMQIAVTHVPLSVDYVRTAVEWASLDAVFSIRRVNLVMAGHYVSGQWRLFGLGPIYVPERGWFPGEDGLSGLQRINSINQYISGGIGASSFYPMPGRLFNASSVSLLTFTARIE